MRKQKRKTCRAMKAWAAANPVYGVIPMAWYAKRHPRTVARGIAEMLCGEIGRIDGFAWITETEQA